MQARQSNGLQSRRAQPQQHGTQNLWLRSKPAPGNGARYGLPQLYQASGDAPDAAALQEDTREAGFRVGHGAGTGPLPMADAMMSAAPPSDASPEDLMNTMNQLKCMIERMREKGPEEGPPLSYLPSMRQDGASASAGYDNHGQEIEYLRKEAETRKKELKAMQQGLESIKNVTKQLEEAYNSLKKMVNESLQGLQGQLSVLINTCPLQEDDPFAYPPLPSA
ncbi:hypothetical protein MY4038_009647 [Beauveria bassiana]